MEAMDKDMEPRDEAQGGRAHRVVRSVGLAPRHRMIVRRELPHPGATFNLFDPLGFRHQVFICDTADPDIAYLEARQRGHARVEDRIRGAKDTGLRNLPFPAFENNACWVELVLMAQDLIAFTQGLVLDGDMAKVEPKRLRYALLHVAGRITTTGEAPPCTSRASGHGHDSWPTPSRGCARWRSSPKPVRTIHGKHLRSSVRSFTPRTIHPRHFQPPKSRSLQPGSRTPATDEESAILPSSSGPNHPRLLSETSGLVVEHGPPPLPRVERVDASSNRSEGERGDDAGPTRRRRGVEGHLGHGAGLAL